MKLCTRRTLRAFEILDFPNLRRVLRAEATLRLELPLFDCLPSEQQVQDN